MDIKTAVHRSLERYYVFLEGCHKLEVVGIPVDHITMPLRVGKYGIRAVLQYIPFVSLLLNQLTSLGC